RAVTVEPLHDRGHVDVHDVALAEDLLLVGDAVADDVVHRGAAVPGERRAAVAERGALRPVVAGDLVDQPVDRRGRDPGPYEARDLVEDGRGQVPGRAHLCYLLA